MRALFLSLAFGSLWLSACSSDSTTDFTEVDRQLQSKEFVAASAALEALRERHGPQAEILSRLAGAYQAQNEYGKAVACYKEGTVAHPQAHELWFGLGSLYLELLQLEQAREAFERARSAGCADAKLALPFGMCLGKLGDLDSAEKEFDRAKAAGVPAALVAYNRAIVLLARGRAREAREQLEEALRLQPEFPVAKRELVRAIVADEPTNETAVSRAITLGWEAVEAMSEDWRSHDALGEAYLARKDWEAAKAAFVEALRLSQATGQFPESLEDHYRQAESMLRAAAKATPKGS